MGQEQKNQHKEDSKKYLCPKCKGEGMVWNHGFGIVTIGLGYILQAMMGKDDICPVCEGNGFITYK